MVYPNNKRKNLKVYLGYLDIIINTVILLQTLTFPYFS
jgi:hypothetical protein